MSDLTQSESPGAALDLANVRLAAPGMRPGFLESVLEDLRAGELAGVTAADLGAALIDFRTFAAAAHGDAPQVRLIRARGEGGRDLAADLLEVVQPDAPFLVDSVMGEVTESGAVVRAMFHPVVIEGAVRRSMIQVWLSPVGPERRNALVSGVRASLDDVRLAIGDFDAMRAAMSRAINDLQTAAPCDPGVLTELVAFLRWMDDGHFVYLGARSYDYPRAADGEYAAEEPLYEPEGSLGVLRDPARRVLRRTNEPAVLSAALKRRLEVAEPVVIAKSNLRSRVHRRVYMDYVGVRRYGADGRPAGEMRFVGLFTADAYDQPAPQIPLLRRKVEHVMDAAGFARDSHNAMRLSNILETYPRDELFQIGEGELLTTALDILHLFDRPKVKLFVRRDPFDRFISALVYTPRDRYDADFRRKAGEILARAYSGRVTAYYPSFSDAPLARVHFIIAVTPGAHLEPDLAVVEAAIIRAGRTWDDDLEAEIRETAPRAAAQRWLSAWLGAFPPGYRDRNDAGEAARDIAVLAGLGENTIAVRAFRRADDVRAHFRFKLYCRSGDPVRLSRVIPILQAMGLSVVTEDGSATSPQGEGGKTPAGGGTVWIHEFLLDDEHGEALTFASVQGPFEAAFLAVWNGEVESDGFNRLVLELGASWREAALIRALARYRQQSGLDPNQAAQEAALAAHPGIVRLILRMFALRFDPATGVEIMLRDEQAATLRAEIDAALQAVESLDEDRVLRRLADLVGAITRTNYYQAGPDGGSKSYISFKIASRTLTDLPSPRPFREIFVSSPVVDGVHLRMGPVARGGLRWSDRRDDFRTEVLGLVKAQNVKNAVIVPVGSKGGFFPKRLPRGGTADAVRAEAIIAYRVFLAGLLDLTDNLAADGAVLHPPGVVVHDQDDPYLVVAADKGTATFSDIANGVAHDYGFWLGDAFASGGSAGYDHKVMAITARGAWESVKRHFRELGVDIQSEPVSVVGIGDMSGDVFGNGMLLSRALRLRAAFDHRDIFIDPEPDAGLSWAERKRLFDLPRSSWNDYDRTLISTGGGVWSRAAKAIPLSAEIKALLEVRDDVLAPADLIVAILKARVDLLYLGGIGTYVKAAAEANLEVGDKANDAIRVNGAALRCKVVGEGANLGFTQAGRIEFARAGGRINTDAIDNSAGVDTSDHEVNIKILTGMAERSGALSRADRDDLLASMTDDVAAHVLAHNYDQTLALSLMQADAPGDLEAQAALMHDLEVRGRLDRALEGLPNATHITERAMLGQGLTRPELSVLMAYGKLDLLDDIVGSTAPDDPYFAGVLRRYFPRALASYGGLMDRHRLRREIIATVVGNRMVNLCGPTFAGRLRAAAACDTRDLVAAFEAARQVLRFDEVWSRIAALDGRGPAAGQTALFQEMVYLLRSQTFWLARRGTRDKLDIASLVAAYRPAVDTMKTLVPQVLSPFERQAAVRRAAGWVKAGAPKAVAHSVALMRPLALAATLSDLAKAQQWPLASAAFVYHKVGGQFGFDRLRAAAGGRGGGGDAYERLAMRRLIEDTMAEQTALTRAVMAFAGRVRDPDHPERDVAAVTAWAAAHAAPAKLARDTLEDVEKSGGGWTFAKLTIANSALRELAAA